MSDTPKTDVAEIFVGDSNCTMRVVAADFARNQERAIAELVKLLRELIDIEGPQPGHVMWATEVKDAIARHGAQI